MRNFFTINNKNSKTFTGDEGLSPQLRIRLEQQLTEINNRNNSANPIVDSDTGKIYFIPLAALLLVITIVLLMFLWKNISPPEQRMSDMGKIRMNVTNWIDSQTSKNYDSFLALSCRNDDNNNRFLNRVEFGQKNTKLRAELGDIIIENITDITINGDNADASVIWHYSTAADQRHRQILHLQKNNATWSICYGLLGQLEN